jgi:hypothetical protein
LLHLALPCCLGAGGLIHLQHLPALLLHRAGARGGGVVLHKRAG